MQAIVGRRQGEVGDCFNGAVDGTVTQVGGVPCEQPHQSEVYATVEIEAPTAEEAQRMCSNCPCHYIDDAEFDNSEVVDTEYEVDESYEVTQVEEPHAI